jgi:N-methylhydantoinase B
VIDALYGVMALAIPEKMTGANCGQSSLIQIGTHDDAGKFSVGVLGGPFMGGMGARADKDGIDCTDHDCSNAFNMPIEVCEAALPILFHRLELWTDSGGAGRSRGGLGYHLDAEWQRGEGMASLKRERQKFAPWGICGGQSAPLCRTMLSSAGQPPQPLTPKSQTTLHPGDRLLLWTTGSGGYGEPERRDAQRVLDDVLDGRVSEAAALHDYKVVIHSGAVDADATAARRDCLTGSTA